MGGFNQITVLILLSAGTLPLACGKSKMNIATRTNGSENALPLFEVNGGEKITAQRKIEIKILSTISPNSVFHFGHAEAENLNMADRSSASACPFTSEIDASQLIAGNNSYAYELPKDELSGEKMFCLKVQAGTNPESGTAFKGLLFDEALPLIGAAQGNDMLEGFDTLKDETAIIRGKIADEHSGLKDLEIAIKALADSTCYHAKSKVFDGKCPTWIKLEKANFKKDSWQFKVPSKALKVGAEYVLMVKASDHAGNLIENQTADRFKVPVYAGPRSEFEIDAGSLFTIEKAVELDLKSDAKIAFYRATEGKSCIFQSKAWLPYQGAGKIAFTLSGADGTKTVCLEAKDSEGHIGKVFKDSIFLDQVKPVSSPQIAATLNAQSSAGPTSVLSGEASDSGSGIDSLRVSIQKDGGASACLNANASAFDATCPVWHATSLTEGSDQQWTWTFALADSLLSDGSTYTVLSKGFDRAGLEQSSAGSDAFVWSNAASASATFTLDAGATYSSDTGVSLDLSDDSNVAEYRLAEGSDCSAASWSAYVGGGSIAHTLSAGEGARTLCLQVRTAASVASSTATDSISLDTIKPDSTPVLAAVLGANSTAGANTAISGTASDATSGVTNVAISVQKDAGASACLNAGKTAFDAACPVWHAAAGTTSWSLALADSLFADAASYEVSSRATDNGGLVQSSFGSDSFTWDGSAPNAAFVIDANAAYTISTAVDLDLTNDSGIDEYRAANSADCSAASWTTYSGGGSISHTLAAGEGAKTVCLQVRDSFDNTSSTATDAISLDSVKPSSIPVIAVTLGASSTAGVNTSISGTASDATSGVASVAISIQKDAGANACLNVGKTASMLPVRFGTL